MAHFAEIDENNVVKQVIVAEQELIDSGVVGDPKNWIKTSYNTRAGKYWDPTTGMLSTDQSLAFRKNFASPGFIYDKTRDAFIPPKPYDSWILDEESCTWNSPVAIPDVNKKHTWDEENILWVPKPR